MSGRGWLAIASRGKPMANIGSMNRPNFLEKSRMPHIGSD